MRNIRLLCFVILLATVFAQPAFAQGTPALDPAGGISLEGDVGANLIRSFVLLSNDSSLANVYIEISPLVNAENTLEMPADLVRVSPADVPEVTRQQTFTLSVQGDAEPGTYTGLISAYYEELLADGSTAPAAAPLELPVEITLQAVPQVAAVPETLNQTMNLAPGFWSPFTCWGSGTPTLGQRSFALLSSSSAPATLTSAEVKVISTSSGGSLPPGITFNVEPAQLPTLEPNAKAATLYVTGSGCGLPPGESSALLQVEVDNMDTVVDVPFTIQAKAGPWGPIGLLVLGLGAGLLIFNWNKNGKAAWDLRGFVNKLQGYFESRDRLQAGEVTRFQAQLKNILGLLASGDDPAAVNTKLTELEGYIQAAQTAADSKIAELTTMREEINQQAGPGDGIRATLRQDLADLEAFIRSGKFAELSDASTQQNETKAEFEAWKVQIVLFDALPEADQKNILNDLNTAKTIDEFETIIAAAQAGTSGGFQELASGVGVGGGRKKTPLQASEGAVEKFFMRLRWQRVAVYAVVYLIAVGAGYVTLYTANPTFGVKTSDYFNLLLWAVSVNLFGAQTINVKEILEQAKTE